MVHQSRVELEVRFFGHAHAIVGVLISPSHSMMLVRSLKACSNTSFLSWKVSRDSVFQLLSRPSLPFFMFRSSLSFASLVDSLININHTVTFSLLSALQSQHQHTSYLQHSPTSTRTRHTGHRSQPSSGYSRKRRSSSVST